jgi:hypothetical protein
MNIMDCALRLHDDGAWKDYFGPQKTLEPEAAQAGSTLGHAPKAAINGTSSYRSRYGGF